MAKKKRILGIATAAGAFLSIVPIGELAADVVRMVDGRRIEGEIVFEDEETLRIQTPFGEMTLRRADVEGIERKPTPSQLYRERLRSEPPTTAPTHIALAAWCESQGLKKEARRHVEEALRLDPSNEAAHKALGHVLFEGEWMTPEEKEKRIDQRRHEEMRSRGFVLHEGRWVTVEEKENLEKGLVLHEGRWLTEEEAKRAQGLTLVDGEWVSGADVEFRREVQELAAFSGLQLTSAQSADVGVASTQSEEFDAHVLEVLEGGLDTFRRVFPVDQEFPGTLHPLFGGRKLAAYILSNHGEYEAFIDFFTANVPATFSADWIRVMRQGDSFMWWDPWCYSAINKGPADVGSAANRTLHNLSHALLNRYRFNYRFLPAWLDEGWATLVEFEVTGHNLYFCVGGSVPRYGGAAPKKGEVDHSFFIAGMWESHLVRRVLEGRDTPLPILVTRAITELSYEDVAKSLSLVQHLIETDRRRFLDFFEGIRRKWPRRPPGRFAPLPKDALRVHEEVVREVYGTGVAELDARWRRWLDSR